MNRSFWSRLLRFLASLRLAVLIILGLAVVSAVGTIYEARYNDAETAQRLVYHSPYMIGLLILLCVNLTAVMVDRWPWRRHHTGFVLAHIGIMILLLGAWMTARYGVDGTMAFQIGEERRHVAIQEREIMVYGSFGEGMMKNLYAAPVDFLLNPPSEEKPFVIPVGSDEIKVIRYYHFAYRESQIVPSDRAQDGMALRFQLENPNINLSEWLRLDRSREESEIQLGPARVVLTNKAEPKATGQNEIFITPSSDGRRLRFHIFDKEKNLRRKGWLAESEHVDTSWMGLKFRVLRWLPKAREEVRFTEVQAASPQTQAAIQIQFRDQTYWVGLNSLLKLFLEDRVYYVVYGQRQIDLGFPLRLTAFRMGKYQGTERAATYESDVEVPGRGQVTISMNQPLKHGGFTFYQSSFSRNEQGEPVISVLSVNYDPGRWVKYLGSLLIVLGSIVLFYFKRMQWLPKRSRQ